MYGRKLRYDHIKPFFGYCPRNNVCIKFGPYFFSTVRFQLSALTPETADWREDQNLNLNFSE
jgi:hypothetical protein